MVHGFRNTRQRQAVQGAFASAGRPLSPREVVPLAQKTVPSLGIATAYRAIKNLLESGWLVSIITPAGSRFEPANVEHHHHFYCRVCSRTFDIPCGLCNVRQMSPRGFVPEDYGVTVTGKCDLCAQPGRDRSGR